MISLLSLLLIILPGNVITIVKPDNVGRYLKWSEITELVDYVSYNESGRMDTDRVYSADDLSEQSHKSDFSEGVPAIGVLIVALVILAVAFLWAKFTFLGEGIFTAGLTGGLGPGLFRQKLSVGDERQLLEQFSFYPALSFKSRKKFDDRLVRFIYEKKFEGRHELEVTQEMKLKIAATAIRMTLGLKTYNFPSFHTFLIFPEPFYSRVSGKKVRGETHGAGIIAFSWKDFLFGLSNDNDNLNLGYHEFAHALFIERFKNNIDLKFMDHYDAWRKVVFTKGKLQEVGLRGTFREYATYNEHEFFAVSVENFFEHPERFKHDLPVLYRLMSKMMNQDPLAPQIKNYNRMNY